MTDLIKCSCCKKKFFENGFGINRLGQRYKTCIECKNRMSIYPRRFTYESRACEHGGHKTHCKICDFNSWLMGLCRSRITMALKRTGLTKEVMKNRSTVEFLGCTMLTLKEHIENQFQPCMSWENHGRKSTDWNMDHHVPLKPKGGDLALARTSSLSKYPTIMGP